MLPLHTPTAGGGCSCGGAGCKLNPDTGYFKGKHPRTINGLIDATTSAIKIHQWWSMWPDANIGVACGDVSKGLVGIDFDDANLYPLWSNEIDKSVAPPLASSLTVQQTGRGYQAFFFTAHPGANTILAKQTDGSPAIETRETGGYVQVAPSRHPNGQTYQLIQGDFEHIPTVAPNIAIFLKDLARTFDAPPINPLASLVIEAKAIAGRTAPAVDWITDKFIERGELALVTAPGGSLKSLLLLHWAACLAGGVPFLTMPDGSGGRKTKPCRVLWLNTDNGQQTHENRLIAILFALGLSDIPLFSITTTDFELKNPDHIKNLYWLADDLNTDVIVIDTLSGCLTGINENSAEEMTTPAANLRALAGMGRTVIGVHHPPKADAEGSRGSSVLPNKVDRVFSVAREKDLITLKPQKVRNAPSPTFTALASLSVDSVTEALIAVNFFDGTGAQQLAELQRYKDRILDALASGPLGTRALYKAAKGRFQVLSQAVSSLILERKIKTISGKGGTISYEIA